MSCPQCQRYRTKITEQRVSVARRAWVAVRTERRLDIAQVNKSKELLREYQDNFARHQAEHDVSSS